MLHPGINNVNKTGKEAVLDVFAGLMRSLMPVAFEYGISAGEASGAVRRSFIEALEGRLKEQRRPTTDARLGVISGLPKSDVSALREAMRVGAALSMRAAASWDQIASVLTVWQTNSNFSGAYGLAMDLDLAVVSGSPRRSFADLAEAACPGADKDTLLDELLAAGSVEVVDGTTVRCLSRSYVPRGADVTRIERMGRFLAVVAGNFVHNLLRAEADPSYFERTVVSDDLLSDRGRDKFLAMAAERGEELTTDLDTYLTGLAASERTSSGKRYGVGVYFFEEAASQLPEARIGGAGSENPNDDHKSNRIEDIDVLTNVRRKE
jgi:Family of unknown function (DUF6502)